MKVDKSQKLIVREIQDVLGNKIKLTEERWQHIISGHPVMKKKLSRIVGTLKAPDVIVKSRREENIWLYHKEFKKLPGFVVVIVHHIRGFIITAYLSEKIKEGEIIWQRS